MGFPYHYLIMIVVSNILVTEPSFGFRFEEPSKLCSWNFEVVINAPIPKLDFKNAIFVIEADRCQTRRDDEEPLHVARQDKVDLENWYGGSDD